MNYLQFRKVLNPMLKPLSIEEQAELLEDENEAAEAHIWGNVLIHEERINSIISGLPYSNTQAIIDASRWASHMRKVLKMRKRKTLENYQGHRDAVLHATSKANITLGIDAIIKRYEYLSRVALGIVAKRLGRTEHMLPLDKEKWLKK